MYGESNRPLCPSDLQKMVDMDAQGVFGENNVDWHTSLINN